MVEFIDTFAVGCATEMDFLAPTRRHTCNAAGGYFGEIGVVDATLGFIVGMVGWVYPVLVFAGEAGPYRRRRAVASAFSTMRLISVGWSIYPLGYARQHDRYCRPSIA